MARILWIEWLESTLGLLEVLAPPIPVSRTHMTPGSDQYSGKLGTIGVIVPLYGHRQFTFSLGSAFN